MICRKKSKADAKHSQKCSASAFFVYKYVRVFLFMRKIFAFAT